MRETVIREKFPFFSKAFFQWQSAELIAQNANRCKKQALRCFRHDGKIDAIISIAHSIDTIGFDVLKEQIFEHGADFLRQYSYMGPATSLHLAKNIGLPVAKPGRHLN